MLARWNEMWSIASGRGVPLMRTMPTSFVPTTAPFGNSNSFLPLRFFIHHAAARLGARTAMQKWPIVPRRMGIESLLSGRDDWTSRAGSPWREVRSGSVVDGTQVELVDRGVRDHRGRREMALPMRRVDTALHEEHIL